MFICEEEKTTDCQMKCLCDDDTVIRICHVNTRSQVIYLIETIENVDVVQSWYWIISWFHRLSHFHRQFICSLCFLLRKETSNNQWFDFRLQVQF